MQYKGNNQISEVQINEINKLISARECRGTPFPEISNAPSLMKISFIKTNTAIEKATVVIPILNLNTSYLLLCMHFCQE